MTTASGTPWVIVRSSSRRRPSADTSNRNPSGLVTREDQRGRHLYRARESERATQRRLLTDLLDRAFGGSVAKLVVQALASRPASADELREIRRLLAAAQKAGERSPGREEHDG
jgi:hypothetical protein